MGGKKKFNYYCVQDFLKTVALYFGRTDYRDKIFNSFYIPHCDHFGEILWKEKSNLTIVPAKKAILQLLRAKLLKHKWGDASLLLLIICQFDWKKNSINHFAEIVWRVGNEVIFHNPRTCRDPEVILKHKQTMGSFLSALDNNHVRLEYAFTLLASQNYMSAFNELKYHSLIQHATSKQRITSDILFWNETMEAYLSLISYVLWKLSLMNGYNANMQEESSQNLATDVLRYFDNVIKKPGCWDMFFLKHAEVLLFFGDYDKLESDLVTYAETNPENPNALKYLYLFLKKFSKTNNRQLKISTLSKLQNLSPADSLVVDLFTLHFEDWCKSSIENKINDKNLTIAAEVLLSMLDYPCWSDNIDLWLKLKSLFKVAKNQLSKPNLKTFRESIWVKTERDQWWPHLYFTINSLNTNNLCLLQAKYYVSTKLQSKNCFYNKKARKKLKLLKCE